MPMNTTDPYIEETVRDVEVGLTSGSTLNTTLKECDDIIVDADHLVILRTDTELRTTGRMIVERAKVTYYSVITRVQRKHNPEFVPSGVVGAPGMPTATPKVPMPISSVRAGGLTGGFTPTPGTNIASS